MWRVWSKSDIYCKKEQDYMKCMAEIFDEKWKNAGCASTRVCGASIVRKGRRQLEVGGEIHAGLTLDFGAVANRKITLTEQSY